MGYNYSLRVVKVSQSYIFKACLKQYKQLQAKGKKREKENWQKTTKWIFNKKC